MLSLNDKLIRNIKLKGKFTKNIKKIETDLSSKTGNAAFHAKGNQELSTANAKEFVVKYKKEMAMESNIFRKALGRLRLAVELSFRRLRAGNKNLHM
jgi:hypothetical protein